ncbi:RHS repeat-associated core domain-containing protein [Streptomyces sp. NPDC058623]|uniref:RHS repeat-associated core domain-containing protein n=1 Tax=Streptomyces sp. NPDC058623 TaxID=3346563 RepID=UPI00364B1629
MVPPHGCGFGRPEPGGLRAVGEDVGVGRHGRRLGRNDSRRPGGRDHGQGDALAPRARPGRGRQGGPAVEGGHHHRPTGRAYDQYGAARTAKSGTAATENPYRFIGGTYDRTTGYLEYGQRWYDPATGRFTTQDPSLPRPPRTWQPLRLGSRQSGRHHRPDRALGRHDQR